VVTVAAELPSVSACQVFTTLPSAL